MDMAGVKKSRSCFLGKVTIAADKVKAVKSDDPAEIRLIVPRDLEKILSSLEKTEAVRTELRRSFGIRSNWRG